MSYKGTLLHVYDNVAKADPSKHYWRVVIDTDDRGEVNFTLWDKLFAGLQDGEGNEPICDVHGLEGERVVFEAKAGGPKHDKDGKETGERWPSTLTMVMPEAEAVEQPPIVAKVKPDKASALAEHLAAIRRHAAAAAELVK